METTVPVKKQESSHWYLPDGSPFYEVEMATKPGVMRPTTLRDARKVNAVPSVTTILSCVRKPGLDRWKIEQAILAALTLPRLPDEPDTAYAARVAEDAEETSRKAADFGTRLHDAIENVVCDHESSAQFPYTFDPDLLPFIAGFSEWFAANIDNLKDSLVDWKTQGTKPGKPINVYDEWCWQQAGYCKAHSKVGELGRIVTEATFAMSDYGGRIDFLWHGGCKPRCKNVVISSTEPGRIEIKEWTNDEIEEGGRVFEAIKNVWQLTNGYTPGKVV